MPTKRGLELPQTKLSEQDVETIRAAAKSRAVNYSDLARLYQVSPSLISLIVRGKRRK